jgi:dihydroorotate dehydrogenase
MNCGYRHLIRPVLFAQDAEEIHRFTLDMLHWASRHELLTAVLDSFFGAPELPIAVFGLHFSNPLGLAAGLDKKGEALPAWAALGFGYCELGAATWQAQPGNPPPRLFRAPPDEAIIHRLGYDNEGALALGQYLDQWRQTRRWPRCPVGINLAKSTAAPVEKAPEDFAQSLAVLWPQADFFVVDLSSLELSDANRLRESSVWNDIFSALQETNQLAARATATGISSGSTEATPAPIPLKPLLVKVSPDLDWTALDALLALVEPRQIAGIVATGVTIHRPTTTDPELSRVYAESGGLSGAPLRARSTDVIRHLYRESRGKVPIIGAGGVFTAADAWEKIAAGASLLQLYTGLVYEGPGIAGAIVTGLLERLGQEGMRHLSEAVGYENRS